MAGLKDQQVKSRGGEQERRNNRINFLMKENNGI
jgi:hypothetical protein